MRRNVLEWACDTVKTATTAVVLTHNVDFLLIQSILLPRLRMIGHPRLTVLADAGCAAGSYSQQRFLLDGLGKRYRVVPVDLGRGRRFHPKAILLAGPETAVLAVGSGNLTHGGWSANKEVWADFVSDEVGGLPALAAFKSYLEGVLALVPLHETITDHVMAAFDPQENQWAAELPEPNGLLGSPAATPLLDRIATLAGDGVEAVTVCTPYFDPEGAALAEIGRRFSAPLNALLQPGRAGLTVSVAAKLSSNISLRSVDSFDEEGRSRFIHAKLFAFRRGGSTLLVAGSANCSKAALMAGPSWGNAELVAIREVAHQEADDLLADLQISEAAPELPMVPPSESWEWETAGLRVLAAHRIGGVVEVAYKPDEPFDALWLEVDSLDKVPEDGRPFPGIARFLIADRPEWIRLHGVLSDGTELVSEPLWVDDETALGITAPERRLRAKLSEVEQRPKLTSSDYLEILELFDQHLRQPVKTVRAAHSASERPNIPAARYRIEDVFADGFGKPPPRPAAGRQSTFTDEDFLSLFISFFSGDPKPAEPQPPNPTENQTEESRNPERDESELLKGKQRLEDEEEARTAAERLRPRLLQALTRIEEAMSNPDFVANRPLGRLAADIGSTALLLRKALADGVLSRDEFRSMTRSLWEALFFGRDGGAGAIPARLARDEAGEAGETFVESLASPRLSAALALWCLLEWESRSPEAAWFRLSAGLLAAKLPWLVVGGTPEEVAAELSRIAGSLLSGVDQDALLSAWRRWVRAGAALAAMDGALNAWSQKDLAALIRKGSVSDGELLWQAGEFCTAAGACRRDAQRKGDVRPLGSSKLKRFRGDWLTPVSDLLETGVLKISEPVRQNIADLVVGLRQHSKRV